LEQKFWPKFTVNMDSYGKRKHWEKETRKRLKGELREQLIPKIREQLEPDITDTVRVALEHEATVAITARCTKRLETFDRTLQDLLNDWDTLHNSAQMGAIRALANDGHKSAAHIVKQTSNLRSRAKALGRSLNLAQVMATPEAAPQHEDVSQEDLAAPTPKPPKRPKLASCDDTPTNQPSIHCFLSPSSNSSRNSSGSVE